MFVVVVGVVVVVVAAVTDCLPRLMFIAAAVYFALTNCQLELEEPLTFFFLTSVTFSFARSIVRSFVFSLVVAVLSLRFFYFLLPWLGVYGYGLLLLDIYWTNCT